MRIQQSSNYFCCRKPRQIVGPLTVLFWRTLNYSGTFVPCSHFDQIVLPLWHKPSWQKIFEMQNFLVVYLKLLQDCKITNQGFGPRNVAFRNQPSVILNRKYIFVWYRILFLILSRYRNSRSNNYDMKNEKIKKFRAK